ADSSAKALFQEAVAAARERDLPRARDLIQQSIRKDPSNPMAWLVFASVAESKRNQLISLQKVLELDPGNAQAIKMVKGLGVDPDQLVGKAPAAPQESPTPSEPDSEPLPEPDPEPEPQSTTTAAFTAEPDMDSSPSSPFAVDLTDEASTGDADEFELDLSEPLSAGATDPFTEAVDIDEVDEGDVAFVSPKEMVPIPQPPPRPEPFAARVEAYRNEALATANAFMQVPPPPDGMQWVKKEDNRAGENEIVVVRAAAGTAIAIVVLVPLIALIVTLAQVPEVRALFANATPTRVRLVEPTSTPTPLTTPTNTPGFTPTPTITPTPDENAATPTITPTFPFVAGDPFNMEPTEIILPGGSGGRAEQDAAILIAEGSYAPAIATLQAERENLGEQAFNANLYYQEARALVASGDPQEALELLDEADTRRVELAPSNTAFIAALAAGRAEANLALARERGGVGQFFGQVEQNANIAIQNDPAWPEPYLLLTERYILGSSFQQAVTTINRALEQGSMTDDLRFYVLQAEVAYAQGRLNDALREAETVLFADPSSERAHALRTQIAIDRENWATASLYVQEFLFYHPRNIAAWFDFGQIRLAEGNPLLAIEAFTRAIELGEFTEQTPLIEAYIARADLYEARGQYAAAMADVRGAADAVEAANTFEDEEGETVLERTDQLDDLRVRQLELTYLAGDFTAAQTLLGELREDNAIQTGVANYMEARLIATGDALVEADYERIANLVNGSIAAIPLDEQPQANALRAEAFLQIGQPDVALNYINTALSAIPVPEWYLLRAEVYEAQGSFEVAILEFERVRALASIIPANADTLNAVEAGIRRNEDNIFSLQMTATAAAP
ncbi:MAG: tetratricopeptide repeat protein, partial [Chloroflexota bacterium]